MRKCSHCRHPGHNSRSCNTNSSFKLFGVRIVPNNHINKGKKLLDLESMRKSKSTGSLQSANKNNADHDGYLSDDMLPVRRTHEEERRKGVAWTMDEHRAFLLGLEKLGKGEWKGISKNYVPNRTPTQIASHAQKYFNRRTSTEKKKRRSSLFDIPLHEHVQIACSSTRIPLQLGNGRNSSLMKTGITPIQVGNARASSLKNTSNIAGIRAVTSELPPLSPLSPMATRAFGLRDFPYVPPHIVDYPPRSEQSFGAAKYKQGASFIPEVSYMYADHGYGIIPVLMPSVNDQLFAKPVPDGSSSQASVIKKDSLEAEVGALAL